LIYVNILNNEEAHYLNHIKDNVFEELDLSNKKLPRIVIFGSSHCDVGLNAKDITEATGIPTFNLCHAGWDNDEKYLKKILEHLNDKDYLVYAKRIDFGKSSIFLKIYNIIFARLKLIPVLRNQYGIKVEKYTEDGDRIIFDFGRANNYPDYKVNYAAIKENLDFQFKSILELANHHSNKKPRIIVISAPILINNIDSLNTKKIEINLDEYPDLLAWVPPVITNEQKYFGYDLFHVNETGRAVWTAQLIHELKRIIK
jgi:hypothetical protein